MEKVKCDFGQTEESKLRLRVTDWEGKVTCRISSLAS